MPSRQRGVALFIALIATVILSLAGVALLRATDSGTSISGNLASKQSTMGPINYAIEQSVAALFEGGGGSIVDKFNHDLNHNYYANIQADADPVKPKGIPAVLYGATPSAYPGTFQTYDDPSTPSMYSVRWVIERMCQGAAPAPGPFVGDPLTPIGLQACDMLPPKVSTAGTHGEERPEVPPTPLYRVSIRVDGPAGTNTVTYAQAMLR
jgi:type IV pilus assembly protein PilX